MGGAFALSAGSKGLVQNTFQKKKVSTSNINLMTVISKCVCVYTNKIDFFYQYTYNLSIKKAKAGGL